MTKDRPFVGKPLSDDDTPPKSLVDFVGSNDLVIGTKEHIFVIVKPDGSLKYGPSYTPDEAAKLLWEALARKRQEAEEERLINQHMLVSLLAVGHEDLKCEKFRNLAAGETDPHLKAKYQQYAELSLYTLEMKVHTAIELGRALATRDTDNDKQDRGNDN